MSVRRDLDRRISRWLEEEIETPASHALLDSTRRELLAARQRRGLALPTWTVPSGVQAAAVVVVVVVVFGVTALSLGTGPGPGVGGSHDRVTPTLPPSPSAQPTPTSSSDGLLAPGTYTTTGFKPSITYTVPAGWRLGSDSQLVGFRLDASVVSGSVEACWQPHASAPDANSPAPGVGTSSDALVEQLRSRSDIDVLGESVDLEIDGLTGAYLDIQGLSDSAAEVFLLAHELFPSTCARNLYGPERVRMGFLDLPDGTSLAIVVGSFAGEAMIEAGSDIVTTFKIERP